MSIARGLVGWWRLDGRLVDESGNGNHGAAAGTTGFSEGKYGQSLNLTGAGRANVPVDRFDGSFTISVWLKTSLDTYRGAIGKYATINNGEFLLQARSSSFSPIQFYVVDNNVEVADRFITVSTSELFMMTEWTHVVAVFDSGNEFRVYLNGVLRGQKATPALQPMSSTVGASIGSWNSTGSNMWDGQIDNVMIYNRALAAHEIRQLYALGSPIGIV